MLVHWATLCAQPLHVTLAANVRAIPAHWVPTCAFRLAGFSWASVLRLRRTARIWIPTCLHHRNCTVAP
eukprot:8750672-Pyramimonas_sp.AAC.1